MNKPVYKKIERELKPSRSEKSGLFFVICVIVAVLIIAGLLFCFFKNRKGLRNNNSTKSDISIYGYDIAAFSGEPYVKLNNNIPRIDVKDTQRGDFEDYSELDSLGRCGAAYANLSKALMPSEERGEIGMIKPSGWHTVKYPDIIEDKYLYNRCHLIAYSLSGENANEKNLITGTRYFNIVGMLPFENEIRAYITRTNNHVLYRVTPVFEGDDLVAKGVIMEAYSVEDRGKGVKFNVFVYNVQPGIIIDYLTGDSSVGN